ncbi:MAG: hypothetical protein LBI77_04085 [Puniceicoccales bacterium]|nr:hypothetical protein [Puniceicoccales bacterium]
MKKWLVSIIFQIVSLSALLGATGVVDPHPNFPSNGDIPQALLPALAPVETGNYWKIILFSSLAIILSFLILILWLRRRRVFPAHSLTPFQQFLRDLHRAKLHIRTEDTKEFCSALCLALKSYLQREYQLPITCRTTEEFLRLFSKSSKFSWDIVSNLTDILQYSDQAKFAGKSFSFDLHRDLFLKTCFFIREVKRIRRSAKPKIAEK